MKTLKGRPIGLKAYMTKEEMIKKLKENVEQWRKEGFSDNEIYNALVKKVRPLIYGFYWARYPEAVTTLKEAWAEFTMIFPSANLPIKNTNQKTEIKRKLTDKNVDFLEQF